MDLNPTKNEVRDPIHGFIYYDDFEEDMINSNPVQRLKFIRQLGMTYQVYPSATHTRFEHSLGVMWLAGKIFDVITNTYNFRGEVAELLDELRGDESKSYWRRVVSLAGLLHDLGHLPFSHAAEEKLGCNHEEITKNLIMEGEIATKLRNSELEIEPLHVAKIALGPKNFSKDAEEFSLLENTLAEIISGEVVGADRMDYLLRDSLYTGVVTGQVDHLRLIDTIRILPYRPGPGDESRDTKVPCLGIQSGGLRTAEALLLARYFMFTQVYYHPVRRSYDIHLGQFMKEWLPNGQYPTDQAEHLSMNDNRVLEAIREASSDESQDGHEAAHRIQQREHFKTVYILSSTDAQRNPHIIEELALELGKEFDTGTFVKYKEPPRNKSKPDFPVELPDKRVVSSLSESRIIEFVPTPLSDFIFGKPENVARMQEICNAYVKKLGERHEPV